MAAPSCDAEHTYESLVRAFAWFGGVTGQVWVDNHKAAVTAHVPGAVRFNERFKQLARHYGFVPKACRPYRPRTKGKVERIVGYAKQHFFQRYRSFESFAHLNQLLEAWLLGEADRRLHGTVKEVVAVRFQRERPALLPLPVHPIDTSYIETRQVGWDAYVNVRGNRYSVPSTYCGPDGDGPREPGRRPGGLLGGALHRTAPPGATRGGLADSARPPRAPVGRCAGRSPLTAGL